MNPTRIESVSYPGLQVPGGLQAITEMPNAAVLIGANGSGKSNFIRFFEMVSWMLRPRNLAEFIERQGGADDQLFRGSRHGHRAWRPRSTCVLISGRYDYGFALGLCSPRPFLLQRGEGSGSAEPTIQGRRCGNTSVGGHREAMIVEARIRWTQRKFDSFGSVIVHLLRDCSTFQFHDTSDGSNFKKRWDVEDNNQLRSHGGNLASILHRLEQEDIRRYETICRHIGRVLPVFDRFAIEPSYGKVSLRWKAKGTDKTIGAHLTSDGSLRFFALVTLLNLPPEMLPSVLLLDEPELGLHPAAVTLIGGMIKALAEQRQVIVATQSPLLVDAFDLNEIFVLDLEDGQTKVRKHCKSEYQHWLDEYTTGELWQKNLLGGRP